jgi:23S rRNA-/tRNA-specific pseudouridylate synthase
MTSFPEIPILYEDEDIVVINKPPFVVVNRSQTHGERTIQDWMEERLGGVLSSSAADQKVSASAIIFGDPIDVFKERVGVVHRLDKETSGVLLLAKNPMALIACMEQFKLRQTEKTYEALVHGKLQPSSGETNLPIGRNPRMRLQFAVTENGKESVTLYNVLQFFPHIDVQKVIAQQKQTEGAFKDFVTERGPNSAHRRTTNFARAAKMYQGFSLVELSPKTGRTHQIRVHLAHLRHPIVGDKVYSGIKRRLIDSYWCDRTFLHAKRLKITHPRTKHEIEFEAPLSDDLQKVLDFVRE